MKKQGQIHGLFRGVICPIFAMIGAGIIFIGGFIRNPVYVFFFVVFCIFVIGIGIYYFDQKHKN